MLYWRIGREELDRPGVLDKCADRAADLNFPFETIAQDMRFIEDAMVPVIVPKEDDGEAEKLVRDLPFVSHIGGIARQLARYAVGVPRRARDTMLAAHAATLIAPERFEDQFVVLTNLDLYSTDVGLDWDDVSFQFRGRVDCLLTGVERNSRNLKPALAGFRPEVLYYHVPPPRARPRIFLCVVALGLGLATMPSVFLSTGWWPTSGSSERKHGILSSSPNRRAAEEGATHRQFRAAASFRRNSQHDRARAVCFVAAWPN